MAYVDGFVASVPTDRRADFVEHSRTMGILFRNTGPRVVDCWETVTLPEAS